MSLLLLKLNHGQTLRQTSASRHHLATGEQLEEAYRRFPGPLARLVLRTQSPLQLLIPGWANPFSFAAIQPSWMWHHDWRVHHRAARNFLMLSPSKTET